MYPDHAFVNDRRVLKTLDDLGLIADHLMVKHPINAERLYDLVLTLREAIDASHFAGRRPDSQPALHDARRLCDLVAVLSDATYLYGTGRTDVGSIIGRAIRSVQSLIVQRTAYHVGIHILSASNSPETECASSNLERIADVPMC